MLEYIIESAFCLSILYVNYIVFFRNSRNYQINRIVLLFAVLFSLLIPTLKISPSDLPVPVIVQNENLHNVIAIPNYLPGPESINSSIQSSTFDFSHVLTLIYLFITLVLLGRFGFNLSKLIVRGYRSDKIEYNDNKLTLVDENINPYTFFNTIFVSKDTYKYGVIEEELILHELAHKNQLHSVDVVIIELVAVFFWFNPIVYLFKRLIITNHEYLADNFVVRSGVCYNDYSKKLLNHTLRNKSMGLASSFNHLLIKNRLIMLSKFEQKNRFAYQLALFVPVVAILFIATAFTSSKNITGFKQKPGTLYTDTLFWSAENNEVYLKGEVRVKYGENDFKGNGSFSVLGKVNLLIVNGKPAPLNSAIVLSGRKCTIVRLTEEEAIQKYGSEGKLGAVEITALR